MDADRDGCNTRTEVLKAEAIVAPEQGPRCKLSGGQWHSPYDDRYINGPSGLDIDHLVPLAEPWDSGASTGRRPSARRTSTTSATTAR